MADKSKAPRPIPITSQAMQAAQALRDGGKLEDFSPLGGIASIAAVIDFHGNLPAILKEREELQARLNNLQDENEILRKKLRIPLNPPHPQADDRANSN